MWYPRGTAEQRFWAKVEKRGPDACWPWKGYLHPRGYGQFWITATRRLVPAHRFALESVVGPLAEAEYALHRCDNRRCCNPAHLFRGDHAANMEDMKRKGRGASGVRNGSKKHPEAVPRGERTGTAKLTEDDVRQIRARLAVGDSLSTLGRQYGVDFTTVSKIKRGLRWSHVPA